MTVSDLEWSLKVIQNGTIRELVDDRILFKPAIYTD